MKKFFPFILLLFTVSFAYSQVIEDFSGETISGNTINTNTGLIISSDLSWSTYSNQLEYNGITMSPPIPYINPNAINNYIEITLNDQNKVFSSIDLDIWLNYGGIMGGYGDMGCDCKSYDTNNQIIETISKGTNELAKNFQFSTGSIKKIVCNPTNPEAGNSLMIDEINFTISQPETTHDILLNGTISAENNQIKNVVDPTDAQDVATKNYTYSKSEVDALIGEIKTELGNQIDNDGDGYSEDGGDCDDSDSEINPTANEVCDNIDNNCNAEIDEGVTNPYYQDVDGDGFGLNGIEPVMTCSPTEGYVSNNQDCDDSNSAVYPGAPELSDGIDNDCDGQIDEQNEQTLVSGHEDSSTFPSEHSPDYSTVISHVNGVSQLLTPNTKITKLIIHPNESKNNVKVIPFLTDENFNVVALGEEYYFDAIEGELHEIILNTELTSTSSFYIGCYENVITKHKPSSCNGKYKWGSGEPAIGITINDGTSNSSNCRSTQAYGY